MIKIAKIVTAEGIGGWYCDDRLAIKEGAAKDGFFYKGTPRLPRFKNIREPGRNLQIILVLDNGAFVSGDCVSVTYPSMGGRDPLFVPEKESESLQPFVEEFQGTSVGDFKGLMHRFRTLQDAGHSLHSAIIFGFSKALLRAVAAARAETVTEVIVHEYGITPSQGMIPLLVQTGDDLYHGVDKAIIKKVEFFPHGLITSLAHFGVQGEVILDYTKWTRRRIQEKGEQGYRPCIHLDLYGAAGTAFDNEAPKVADYLARLEEAAAPFQLYIETPVEMNTREQQLEAMASVRHALHHLDSRVKLVVDEWCHTIADLRRFAAAGAIDVCQIKMPDVAAVDEIIEAVLVCKDLGVEPYLGGSCNETAESAQLTAQIGLATSPAMMLAKPGMGMDEGVMIMRNEMARVLAVMAART